MVLSITKASFAKRLRNLLEIGALLAFLSLVAGFLGRWHFLLDLASHFRIQATLVLILCGSLMVCLQRTRWTLGVLAIGLMFVFTLVPLLDFGATVPVSDYRLFTMNVLTSNQQKAEVLALIQRADPDIVVLQETDEAWIRAFDTGLQQKWPYQKAVPRADNFGIAIYSKLPILSCQVKQFSKAIPTPSICAELQVESDVLRVIATHPLPPMNAQNFAARNELFAALATHVVDNDPESTMVVGDLNCTPWSPWFKQLCRDSTLKNSMRGQGLGISWTPFRFPLLGLPIDHVLVGAKIAVVDREVGGPAGSDHRPVVVDFLLEK